MTAFHDVLFPLDIALKSSGGPQRRTDVVTLGSGREERNARWAHSRRRYDAGYGVKTHQALSQVIEFFEERRGPRRRSAGSSEARRTHQGDRRAHAQHRPGLLRVSRWRRHLDRLHDDQKIYRDRNCRM
jgi:hypothetical protein